MMEEELLAKMRLNPDPLENYNEENVDLNDIVETYAQEYNTLDQTLDQLDSCLDSLEARNGDLYSRLQELLEDSRQTRNELLEARENTEEKQSGESTNEDEKPNTTAEDENTKDSKP